MFSVLVLQVLRFYMVPAAGGIEKAGGNSAELEPVHTEWGRCCLARRDRMNHAARPAVKGVAVSAAGRGCARYRRGRLFAAQLVN